MANPTLKPFYNSKPWYRFRYNIIMKRGLKCEYCGKIVVKEKELHVHHTPIELTEHNFMDATVSLNPDNVKLACQKCHNKEHDRFVGGRKPKQNRTVHIVYGPPCSGKNSYVREHMVRGDIIVDMDLLYQAVSGLPLYDKPDNIKYNVMAIKNLIVDNVKTRYGGFNHAYIVGGYASKVDREMLAKDLGAELIYIESTIEECMERLSKCTDYRGRNQAEWIRYISKWFEDYQE